MKHKFDDCLFDPTQMTGKKRVQEVYPELLPYKEYFDCTVMDWQVGVCLTDIGSPFIKIKDHKQRLDAIFEFFNFNRLKGDTAVAYERALEYRPCGIIDVCTFMIEYQNNHDFAAWWIKNKSYYDLMNAIAKPMGEDESEDRYWDRQFKNQDRASKIALELKTLETNLFGSAAMKSAAARSKQRLERNYAEKYSMKNQVE